MQYMTQEQRDNQF